MSKPKRIIHLKIQGTMDALCLLAYRYGPDDLALSVATLCALDPHFAESLMHYIEAAEAEIAAQDGENESLDFPPPGTFN